MNKERVGLLVAALESGEFEQTEGRLRNGDKYCCLGVACEIYRRETGNGEWKTNAEMDAFFFGGRAGSLPPEVQKWYGFKDGDPEVCRNGDRRPVSVFNDNGIEFPEIAALFREEAGL